MVFVSCVYLFGVEKVKPLQFLRVGPQKVDNVTLVETRSSSVHTLLLVPQLWVAKQFDTPQTSMGIGAILRLSIITLLISLHSSHSL